MSNDTSYHSTLRIIFWTRTAKSESQSVPRPLHFHQLAFSFLHAYEYAYSSPEISGFSLLSNNLALLNFYVYHPCVPLSSKLVSSSSVASFSLPLSYLLSLMLQNHSLDTFNTYLWSILGWLCELCYTVDFLLLSHIYTSGVLFHTPSYCGYACFSAPLLQEILWLSLEKTEFMSRYLQKGHVPRTFNKPEVSLSLSSCPLCSSVFLSGPELLSFPESYNVIWKISPTIS